ncbi:RluA family pseudouridine synthase [Peribacillus alkalitolerans]|uniref:RluA family pseudouridine synthase n=1 Tax=Peribacillus alkalitolerans TaxID=1550385 RepID=UPI0013D193D7|nr:RluA family pseudouridine synthase [Peribacillus alkalitolerans]
MEKRFCLSWQVVSGESGFVLREFLKIKHISKSALTDIKFDGGTILVNGEEATVRRHLAEGDEVVIYFPLEAPSEGLIAEIFPLEILYEDDFVLIVNKPPFMNTIPSREHPTGSLANGLAGYYKEKGIGSTIHVVTRLDRDTSGLVLIAKHRHVHHLMSEQQKSGGVKRLYEAFVHGDLENGTKKIEAPIGRRPTSIIEREVREDGQYACTFYEVLGQYDGFSHVRLRLMTGRTHQIRVHMSYIGNPLLGDDLYGGKRDMINRQALHCQSVTFYHPFLEKELSFSIELPDDMKRIKELDRTKK